MSLRPFFLYKWDLQDVDSIKFTNFSKNFTKIVVILLNRVNLKIIPTLNSTYIIIIILLYYDILIHIIIIIIYQVQGIK